MAKDRVDISASQSVHHFDTRAEKVAKQLLQILLLIKTSWERLGCESGYQSCSHGKIWPDFAS
jgi:hypothetical protein